MRELKIKPKQLFNYVGSKQKVKVGVSRLERGDGELTETDEEATNVLNKFFESVFSSLLLKSQKVMYQSCMLEMGVLYKGTAN